MPLHRSQHDRAVFLQICRRELQRISIVLHRSQHDLMVRPQLRRGVPKHTGPFCCTAASTTCTSRAARSSAEARAQLKGMPIMILLHGWCVQTDGALSPVICAYADPRNIYAVYGVHPYTVSTRYSLPPPPHPPTHPTHTRNRFFASCRKVRWSLF